VALEHWTTIPKQAWSPAGSGTFEGLNQKLGKEEQQGREGGLEHSSGKV